MAEVVGSKSSDADDEFLAVLAAAEEEAASLPAVGSLHPSNSTSDPSTKSSQRSNKPSKDRSSMWTNPVFIAAGLIAAVIAIVTVIVMLNRSGS